MLVPLAESHCHFPENASKSVFLSPVRKANQFLQQVQEFKVVDNAVIMDECRAAAVPVAAEETLLALEFVCIVTGKTHVLVTPIVPGDSITLLEKLDDNVFLKQDSQPLRVVNVTSGKERTVAYPMPLAMSLMHNVGKFLSIHENAMVVGDANVNIVATVDGLVPSLIHHSLVGMNATGGIVHFTADEDVILLLGKYPQEQFKREETSDVELNSVPSVVAAYKVGYNDFHSLLYSVSAVPDGFPVSNSPFSYLDALTCAFLDEPTKTLVTGSEYGEIVCWSLPSEKQTPVSVTSSLSRLSRLTSPVSATGPRRRLTMPTPVTTPFARTSRDERLTPTPAR
jgi:hypothetical protein